MGEVGVKTEFTVLRKLQLHFLSALMETLADNRRTTGCALSQSCDTGQISNIYSDGSKFKHVKYLELDGVFLY